MLGSCKISSRIDIALEALTAGVYCVEERVSTAAFAALLMLRGVVVSSDTRPRMAKACFILSSYSFNFFLLTISSPSNTTISDIQISHYNYLSEGFTKLLTKILSEAKKLSKKQNEIQPMVDLLRQGATLTDLSCPACSSPLFRLRSRDLWCAQCQKRVIVVKEGEKPPEQVTPLLSTIESTILTKIQEMNGKIKEEKNLEDLQRLSEILSTLLESLERVKKMKKQ